MEAQRRVEQRLRSEELRAGFLRFTREAYALLPALHRPRILDIGCGTGAATIELARLSGGEVVGIDTDARALTALRERLEKAAATDLVRAVHGSLFDVDSADGDFDLLWEEGVFHLLDARRSVRACSRLVRDGGYLVMHETVAWFEGIEPQLSGWGFRVRDSLLLPKRAWWTFYYAPLEARIRAFREEHGGEATDEELAQHEREIAMVKADPDRFDCGFFVLEKS